MDPSLTTDDSRKPLGELQKQAKPPSRAIILYVDKSVNNQMRDAAKSGNVLELTRLLNRGANVERTSTAHRTPLMRASV